MKREDANNNIVPFPGSADRLVNEGLKKLKEGDKQKALQQFLEALMHNPDHEDASYGLLLAYADTGQLLEGKKWAETMMQKASGDYFEVLQVYVSILAQLGEYDKVVTILEAVQAEDQFPARMAEQLFELLELSRHMARTEIEQVDYKQEEGENDTSPYILEEWENRLRNGTSEQKLAALGEMRSLGTGEAMPIVEKLLADQHYSPLMQSFLLFLLKDWNVDKNVWVEKLERKGEFSPAALRPIEESTSYIKSSQLLDETLGHKDPILLKNAHHLLREILLYFYPFPPSVQIESLAAVLHFEASYQSGAKMDVSSLAVQYGIAESSFYEVREEYEKLKSKLSDI
ncbi:M48 family metallopeptidase [Alteribacillus sp. YIM 98480]|uniref:tetratricopeptide repeat protein n=1 Tax=Alteribacillus sp. YIM 98480 TaxID=2606599 RepID=UPI00131CAD5D|nr:hypothetical protein [Alteribacillus sp. YIM 98480]